MMIFPQQQQRRSRSFVWLWCYCCFLAVSVLPTKTLAQNITTTPITPVNGATNNNGTTAATCSVETTCTDCLAAGCAWTNNDSCIPECPEEGGSSTSSSTNSTTDDSTGNSNIFNQNNNNDNNNDNTTSTASADTCIDINSGTCPPAVDNEEEEDDTTVGLTTDGSDTSDAICTLLGSSNCTACMTAGDGTCAWRTNDNACTVQCLRADTRTTCVTRSIFPATFTPQDICNYESPVCSNITTPPPTTTTANNNTNTSTSTSTNSDMEEDITCEECLNVGCSHFQIWGDGPALCLNDCSPTENITDTACFSITTPPPRYENITITTTSPLNSSQVCKALLDSLPFYPNDGVSSVAPRPVPGADNGDGGNGTNVNGTNIPAPAPTLAPNTPCTTQEECSEGSFCSSSSNTCMVLNCTNWIEGTPTDNVFYNETPCGDQERAFCGSDGICHQYSCESWYKFGPVAYTGYDPSNPKELECEEYDTGFEDNMNSIVFGCRPYSPGKKAPEARSWAHPYSQKCSATPRNGYDYVCYNNLPTERYRQFQADIARQRPPSCDRETYEPLGIEQPIFWYNLNMMVRTRDQMDEIQNDPVNAREYKTGRENTVSTASFDASEADDTMFAVVYTDNVNEPPKQTFGPQEVVNTTDTSSAADGAIVSVIRWKNTLLLCAALVPLLFDVGL